MISPIPKSVHRIEVDQVYSLSRRLTATGEYSLYVFRFDIGSEDVERIITSNAMTEWPNVRYDFGGLYYTTLNGAEIDIHLYSVTRPKPNWFDLPKWKSFTTYYWGDEGTGNSWERARLLLYNKQLGRAYFIKKDITGL